MCVDSFQSVWRVLSAVITVCLFYLYNSKSHISLNPSCALPTILFFSLLSTTCLLSLPHLSVCLRAVVWPVTAACRQVMPSSFVLCAPEILSMSSQSRRKTSSGGTGEGWASCGDTWWGRGFLVTNLHRVLCIWPQARREEVRRVMDK